MSHQRPARREKQRGCTAVVHARGQAHDNAFAYYALQKVCWRAGRSCRGRRGWGGLGRSRGWRWGFVHGRRRQTDLTGSVRNPALGTGIGANSRKPDVTETIFGRDIFNSDSVSVRHLACIRTRASDDQRHHGRAFPPARWKCIPRSCDPKVPAALASYLQVPRTRVFLRREGLPVVPLQRQEAQRPFA